MQSYFDYKNFNFHSLEIVVLDTSSIDRKYLLINNNKQFEISESVANLIEVAKECNSYEEIAYCMSERNGKLYTENEIIVIFEKCIKPLFSESSQKPSIKYRKEIISNKSLSVITSCFNFLFNRKIAFPLLSILLILEICFFTKFNHSFYFDTLTMYHLMGGGILFFISSLFHEIGHATACRSFECQHGGVGFGLYLIFPVFYTDVTKAWRLSRKKRLIIDFSGVYFQLIFLMPFFLIYFFSSNEIVRYFIYIVNLNFLFTLNPFFKFDGYWIVSDILGVPNLRSKTYEMWKYLYSKMKGSNAIKPTFVHINLIERIFIVVYFIVINIFFIYFFFYTMPQFVSEFINSFPKEFLNVIESMSLGNPPSILKVFPLLMSLLFFSIIIFFVLSTLFSFGKIVFRATIKQKCNG